MWAWAHALATGSNVRAVPSILRTEQRRGTGSNVCGCEHLSRQRISFPKEEPVNGGGSHLYTGRRLLEHNRKDMNVTATKKVYMGR